MLVWSNDLSEQSNTGSSESSTSKYPSPASLDSKYLSQIESKYLQQQQQQQQHQGSSEKQQQQQQYLGQLAASSNSMMCRQVH